MLPSKPPSRPRTVNAQSVTVNHQQTRHSQHMSSFPAREPISSLNLYIPPPWRHGGWIGPRARSQIEELPPMATVASTPSSVSVSPPSIYNPSMRHPVFFTERLRKLPFQLPVGPADVLRESGASAARSPCADGYVYEDGRNIGKRGGSARL